MAKEVTKDRVKKAGDGAREGDGKDGQDSQGGTHRTGDFFFLDV